MAMLPPDPVFTLKGDMAAVSSLSYQISQYQEHLYVGTINGKIHIWDLETNRKIKEFHAGSESCLSILMLEDKVIVTQEKGGKLRWWDYINEEWKNTSSADTDYYGFCKCAVLDQEHILCPGRESKINLITSDSDEPIKVYKPDDQLGEVMCFKVVSIADDRCMLVGYESGDILLWNIETSFKHKGIKLSDSVMCLDFDPRTMRGICGSPSHMVQIFRIDKDFNFGVIKEIKITNPGVACVAIRPDSRIVALGCWDSKIRIYSWKNLIGLAVLDSHTATVETLCFSNKRVTALDSPCLLAAGSKDCSVTLWDLYN